MNSIRRKKIKEYIQENGLVSIRELCALTPEVSLMTIHRDLDYLAEEGSIVRVRGGARPADHAVEAKYEAREKENSPGKLAIARKAVTLIAPGSAIFLDAGTTAMALARAIPDIDLSIFTTGPTIALELMRLSLPSINICCGNLNRANLALSGRTTIEMLSKINIDTAFIGVSGYTPESGFCCGKESERDVKLAVIRKARTVVLLMDSTKYSRLLPFTFARLRDADYIVADGNMPEEFLSAARDEHVTVL